MNNTIRIQKRALASAIAMAMGASSVPQTSVADITLTFQNNTTPSAAPLPYTQGFSAGVVFPANTEFRVMTPYGSATNDGFKDAMFGGENWTFDNSGDLIGTSNVANAGNPGTCQVTSLALCTATLTSGVSGFPICTTPSTASCPVMEQGADFLGAGDFNFLAPVKGSIPGNTYGVATIDIDLDNNSLSTHFPVTHAQWADGSYIIGADDPTNTSHGDKFVKGAGPGVPISDLGGVTVTSAPGAADITLDFVLHGESRMTKDEVTVGGFNKQIVQWELPGSATINNQNPVAVDDGSVASRAQFQPGTATDFDVLSNDTDPDFALLGTPAFDAPFTAIPGTCSNGGTLTTSTGTNVTYFSAVSVDDTCTYTISDARGGVSAAPATLFLTPCNANCTPTAVPDRPGGPGGPYQTNQSVAVSVDVLANDTDIDNDPLTVIDVDSVSVNGGAVVIINGGVEGGANVMYTPVSGFNGTDSFTYQMQDKDGLSNRATVEIQVDAFAESSAGTVTVSNLVSAASIPVSDPETNSSCAGGCFETEVTGVPAGSQVEILAPKRSNGYETGAVFRQFVDSTQTWKAYEAPDSVQTAPEDSGTGLCPGLASGLWRTPTEGDTCTKYTLTDNGPNDDNPVLGEIRDPVGFAQATVEQADQQDLGASGCTIDKQSNGTWRNAGHWMLIGAFVAFVRLFRKKAASGNNF